MTSSGERFDFIKGEGLSLKKCFEIRVVVMNAIGIVEVVGVVASVEALDSMTKTSNVKFKTMEKKLGGRLVTIVVEGSVEDVQAAVEVGTRTADSITKCVAHAVIPRAHEEIMALLDRSSLKFNKAR